METTEMNVAQTIYKQVGFWAFAEVGARDFGRTEDSLQFTAKPKNRLVRVMIRLMPSDTYNVWVYTIRDNTILYKLEDVYADMLPEIIRNLAKNM